VPIALLVPERTPNAFATALPLGSTRRRATTQPDSRAALLFRGLLFRFGLSVTSDAKEMVPTGRRADSL
jgi:hypothetical protein